MVLIIRTASPPTIPLLVSSRTPTSHLSLSKAKTPFFPRTTRYFSLHSSTKMNWLGKLGFGSTTPTESSIGQFNSSSIAQGADDDIPRSGQQFAQFGAGCFWGVELAFQRVAGVSTTEVGYTQGHLHNPTYNDVCSKTTNHSEVVRVQYDPKDCDYGSLLDVFWARHDPTTLNRQGNDVGTQYRSGIYYYTPEQEKAAFETLERQQKLLNRKIVTEILPAKKFYRAEEYHQQYLAKGVDLVSDNPPRRAAMIQ